MLTSGLTNAPVSKYLLIYIIASSVALAIFDVKHLVSIQVSPHLWQYGQLWRTLVWQIAGFANSTEALFGAMLAYHLRIVERSWGRRKTATFLLTTLPYTTLLPPFLLAMLVRPLTLNKLNYLPSGPTAALFALLAQYYAFIPHTFRYRLSTTSSPSSASTSASSELPSPSRHANDAGAGADSAKAAPAPHPPSSSSSASARFSPSLTLLLSDKSTTYLVAAQLALSQFPAMLLPAVVGWFVGLAWRAELLPGLSSVRGPSGWRVPAWMVGETEPRASARANRRDDGSRTVGGGGRYEDLRRRLEGEAAAAGGEGNSTGAGVEGGGRLRRQQEQGGAGSGGLLERIRGAF